MSTSYRISVLPGDGIGKEVIPEACRTLRAVASDKFDIDLIDYDLGSERYLRTNEAMPESVFAEISSTDSILVGALGQPEGDEGVLRVEIEERFRLEFDLCVGHRPAKLLPGVQSPLSGLVPEDFDVVVVRENSEGLYQMAGGRAYPGTSREVAIQDPITTWYGVERVVRFAFGLAAKRRQHLTLAHKASLLQFTGGLWVRAFEEVGKDFPDVRTDYAKIDSACVQMISDPARFDVVVSDVIFGDILSDVAAVIQGGKHLAPSGMVNPEGGTPGFFEPLHGPAHDIAGTGTADPTGAILTAGMLLDHLGEWQAADRIENAVRAVRSEWDDGWSTRAAGDAILRALES